MLFEFERQLADVLGTRLPPPFQGHVSVPPRPDDSDELAILVGVRQATRAEPDLGSHRPEVVPDVTAARRIVRLSCVVGFEILPGTGDGRDELLEALDALIYELDAPDLRSGEALLGDGDPGFVIHELSTLDVTAPLDPAAADAEPVGLSARATGWFWPVGTVGESGIQIGEIRLRGALLPIHLVPATPEIVAAGPAVNLTIQVRGVGQMSLDGSGTTANLPFGNLALRLSGPGGRPGAGSLSGGTEGNGGVRLVPLTNGSATISYTPPATTAIDTLVVALDDGEGGASVEAGRLTLTVREG